GKGSTFVVCLPALGGQTLHTTTKTGSGPSAESSAGPRREAAGLGGDASHPPDLRQRSLRILVIDDQATVRRFLEIALGRLGHRPRTAVDANEGLAAFKEERFDLVLTDFGLPGMNGKEVARVVHQMSPETPVILLTGWSNQLQAEVDSM